MGHAHDRAAEQHAEQGGDHQIPTANGDRIAPNGTLKTEQQDDQILPKPKTEPQRDGDHLDPPPIGRQGGGDGLSRRRIFERGRDFRSVADVGGVPARGQSDRCGEHQAKDEGDPRGGLDPANRAGGRLHGLHRRKAGQRANAQKAAKRQPKDQGRHAPKAQRQRAVKTGFQTERRRRHGGCAYTQPHPIPSEW